MTYREFVNVMYDVNRREELYSTFLKVLDNLTPISKGELLAFQAEFVFYDNQDMHNFFTKQSQIMEKCIDMEISWFGRDVRKIGYSMDPIEWDMEIE